jgi:hypothetical protein
MKAPAFMAEGQPEQQQSKAWPVLGQGFGQSHVIGSRGQSPAQALATGTSTSRLPGPAGPVAAVVRATPGPLLPRGSSADGPTGAAAAEQEKQVEQQDLLPLLLFFLLFLLIMLLSRVLRAWTTPMMPITKKYRTGSSDGIYCPKRYRKINVG